MNNVVNYKVLTYKGNPVNESLLDNGLYTSAIPYLRSETDTIDVIKKEYKKYYKRFNTPTDISEKTYKRLDKCELVTVKVSIVKFEKDK